jgi:hypothetical protein
VQGPRVKVAAAVVRRLGAGRALVGGARRRHGSPVIEFSRRA